MEKTEFKKEIKIENEAFKERFQFILSVNDNIICQRYFKINGFNNDSLESVELKYTLDECVQMIQEDLESKSRVFQWYTRDEPVKLTGFENPNEETHFNYPSDIVDSYTDNERLQPYEVTFKFAFLVDEKSVYERIWDGTNYPKYVRNGVDLSNSDVLYRDKEPLSLHFSVAIVRHMTIGKTDLNYHIIRKICDVTSSYNNEIEYTKHEDYGKVKIPYNTRNRKWINNWNTATRQKTNEYFGRLYPSPKQLEYIDKYL